MGVDMDTARGAEWLAGERKDGREKVKQRIPYAVLLHQGVGELDDTQRLEVRNRKRITVR